MSNPVGFILTDENIEALGHRIAWRYKKSSDPNHSDTYTFNWATLLQFSEAVEKAVAAAVAKRCADVANEFLTQGRSPLGKAVADAIRREFGEVSK